MFLAARRALDDVRTARPSSTHTDPSPGMEPDDEVMVDASGEGGAP